MVGRPVSYIENMNKRNIFWISIIFIIVFIGYFLFVFLVYPNMEKRGQFGDMFGALNTLFSGAAFLGVIYAILLQKEELGLQRKELELARGELKRTAEAQERSAVVLSKQAASLKISATLNGKSAILQHHNTLIEVTQGTIYNIQAYRYHKEASDRIVNDIENLIEDK